MIIWELLVNKYKQEKNSDSPTMEQEDIVQASVSNQVNTEDKTKMYF